MYLELTKARTKLIFMLQKQNHKFEEAEHDIISYYYYY